MSPLPEQTVKLLHTSGRIIGMISGTVSCLLWTAAIWDPASGFSLSTASFAVVLMMLLIGAVVVIASIKANSTMLLVLFVVAFLPVGLYLIGVPYWIRWVGLSNLGYLLAGLLLRVRLSVSGTNPT